jgi:phage head maturation protease
MNLIEHRQDGLVADVSYPNRVATVIVAPYDTPTTIHEPGHTYTELIARGAWDGVQRRAGRIRANRGHDWDRIAGKVTELYPDRQEGLVAEVRMFKTDLGEETLELCADDGLSVSAGFAPMREGGSTGPVKPGWQTWNRDRTERRLNSLWLDHVAFVANPAYPTATVLGVRQHGDELLLVARPNLAKLQIDEQRRQLAAMDARWNAR